MFIPFHRLLLLTWLILTWAVSVAQSDIAYIRERFREVNTLCQTLSPLVLTSDTLSQEGSMTFRQWEQADDLIKFQLIRHRDAGTFTSDFYFGEGGLVFAFTQDVMQKGDGKAVRENRYYFKGEDTMIRWLDEEKKPVDPTTTQFAEAADRIWADVHWSVEYFWMHQAAASGAEVPEKDLFIGPDHFDGIITGGALTTFAHRLREGTLETGEGQLPVHYIMEGDEKLGYLFPHRTDPDRIGTVVVVTSRAVTQSGIRVGSTFAALKSAYPNLQVHGSELESRTTAEIGKLRFLLDAYVNTYQLKETSIAPETRIKEIAISPY